MYLLNQKNSGVACPPRKKYNNMYTQEYTLLVRTLMCVSLHGVHASSERCVTTYNITRKYVYVLNSSVYIHARSKCLVNTSLCFIRCVWFFITCNTITYRKGVRHVTVDTYIHAHAYKLIVTTVYVMYTAGIAVYTFPKV